MSQPRPNAGAAPPTTLPTPRGAHLEMIGAVIAGDGLERVAEIAAEHAGAPVAVVVPRVRAPVAAWADYERYVAARLAGGRPQRPGEIVAEVPIASGGQELGAVLLLGRGCASAGEYLHVAAVAALTEVAVAEAREDTERSLRASEEPSNGAAQGRSAAFAANPEDAKAVYRGTVAPIVAHDEQYGVNLVATLATYLDHDCDVHHAARSLNAQRHTVLYRLERVRELTGLDASSVAGRERLALGLEAYRVVAPSLPR
jgi:hypothetical protein